MAVYFLSDNTLTCQKNMLSTRWHKLAMDFYVWFLNECLKWQLKSTKRDDKSIYTSNKTVLRFVKSTWLSDK